MIELQIYGGYFQQYKYIQKLKVLLFVDFFCHWVTAIIRYYWCCFCKWIRTLIVVRNINHYFGLNVLLFNNQVWYSSPPDATYMCQWIGLALVQIMACRLYAAPSHYLNQFWFIINWTLKNKLQWNFNQNKKKFHSRKCIWKCRLPKWRPFCSVGDESK